MVFVDLSYDITEDICSWPGHPHPAVKTVLSSVKEGYEVKHISFMSHVGTHIDAPSHTLQDGLSLNDIPVSQYMGPALIIDVCNIKDQIEVGDLLPYAEQIEQSKFVVFHCGHQRYWHQNEYFYGHPVISKECALWLSGFDLYGIGLDTFSPEPVDTKTSIVHRTLAAKGMVIIENLAQLKVVLTLTTQTKGMFFLSALPIKIPDADGSPVRAVAIIDSCYLQEESRE